MKMPEHPVLRKLTWLGGTIVVGALGSGLWEAALKPSLYWVGTFMLDVATLGLSSLRDGMYEDAAKGSYERAGLILLALSTGAFSAIATMPIVARSLGRKDSAARTLATNWTFTVTFGLAVLIVLFVQMFRVSYITRAATHIEQLLRITAPYQTEEQRLNSASQFAQVTTRDEYRKLVVELENLAKSRNAHVPRFEIY